MSELNFQPTGGETFHGPGIIVPSNISERAWLKMGPLLRQWMSQPESPSSRRNSISPTLSVARATAANSQDASLPTIATVPRMPPVGGETWKTYKDRVFDGMGPILDRLKSNAGLSCIPSFSANAMNSSAEKEQIQEALRDEHILSLEMDLPRRAILLDDVVFDLDMPHFRRAFPNLDGTGISVAVLDSGIDLEHPWLNVLKSVNLTSEDLAIPGAHATHVAGCIASRDLVYPGISQGVNLYNIRILDSSGFGPTGAIGLGIDKALDDGIHILNLSAGFNHRPMRSYGGHSHECRDGRCPVCTAVDNAMTVTDGAVAVVVAAGNEHQFCESLRANGDGGSFDTELTCPGQSRMALTVGALTKKSFIIADFSSRGPTSYGTPKPDISGPGVNIISSGLVSRDVNGQPIRGLSRTQLSLQLSGTSMATPIVTGVAALLLQELMEQRGGRSVPELRTLLRQRLTGTAFQVLANPPNEVGVGRISLAGL